jgi:hypothetical protein
MSEKFSINQSIILTKPLAYAKVLEIMPLNVSQ